MKTIIRNFLSVLRRFKMATGLTIAGLAVAFAAFIVILIQVRYEYNFDRFHRNVDRLYRVDLTDEGLFGMIQSCPFVDEFVNSSPHIEMGGLIKPFNLPSYFYKLTGDHKTGFNEEVIMLEPQLMKMFDFPVVLGDPDCLDDPEKVMIPQSLAEKIFGNENPIGKQIHTDEDLWLKWMNHFTIGAVFNDLPGNTQFRNGIYMAIAKDDEKDNWHSRNYFAYVLLDSPASAKLVEDNFNRNFDFSKVSFATVGADELSVKLTPVANIYFNENLDAEWVVRTGSREMTFLLVCIALFIVVIAAINFTNFSTALTPLRIKSINTQKVLGSSDRMLRTSLLSEAILISFLSCLIAIGIVSLLQQTALLSFMEADLNIADNLPVIWTALLLSVIVGLIAGLYPARYMTSFPPALVLKGSFGLSPKGRQLRTILMGFQFVVSTVLIIVSVFVYLQRDYIKNYTYGFDKDQIAVVDIGEMVAKNSKEAYVNTLKQYPGIEDVAFANDKVGSKDIYSINIFKYLGEDVLYYQLYVSNNFLEVMGIPLIEGRVGNNNEKEEKIIFTRSIQDKYDISTGWRSLDEDEDQTEIIGFCENVNLTSLRQGGYNIAFIMNNPWQTLNISYVRMQAGTNYREAVEHIRKTMNEIDPAYPVEVKFYDEFFNELYKKEENLNKMIMLFSLLAILISIVGVFGLVVFETQYRKKEIGVRKVMGAEVLDILIMFNKSYFYIVVVCFLIAVPVAYYSVVKWLENFATRTPIYIWVFAASFVVISLIVMITVTLQNWRAATDNPVESIKSE
ncbi:MAG: ABC transporter permease [Tannerellaceae bacterium]|nr:ABC transporter permease [Tannerellaceae bacterium]